MPDPIDSIPPEQVGTETKMNVEDLVPGTSEYVAHWGLDGPYQKTLEYNDGFGAFPDRSTNACPHPDGPGTIDVMLRRRWIKGYVDHGTLAGAIGNPTEETVAKIYGALPVELKDIAQAPGGPKPDEEQDELRQTEPPPSQTTGAEMLRELVDEVLCVLGTDEIAETAKLATGNTDSLVRAVELAEKLGSELKGW